MVRDPVCGIEVDPTTAMNKTIYQGEIYYFCSEEDKLAFDKDPGRYVKPEEHDQDQRMNQ